MQKVKVTRYVSGRRPEYAQSESESESSEDEEGFIPGGGAEEEEGEEGLGAGLEEEEGHEGEGGGGVQVTAADIEDRRLRRLRDIQAAGSGSR